MRGLARGCSAALLGRIEELLKDLPVTISPCIAWCLAAYVHLSISRLKVLASVRYLDFLLGQLLNVR